MKISNVSQMRKLDMTAMEKFGIKDYKIIDNKTGYLVGTVSECAERVLHLLRHPEEAERLGQAGKEHVRENFLTTRHLRDYLYIFRTLAGVG